MAEKLMRIMHSSIPNIPWEVIAGHEQQAERNHRQSLTRLNERGGLSACEAVAIIEDRPWHRMNDAAADHRLMELVKQHRSALAAPSQPAEPVAQAQQPTWEAIIIQAAQDAKEVFKESCNHTHEAIDYMKAVLLAHPAAEQTPAEGKTRAR